MAVCVLGSINRDIVSRVARLPSPGETVAARETLRLAGGKGANQAIAAMRMGAATRMIGAVGDDADGAALVATLAAEGVDVRAVAACADAPTGAAYVTLDDAGENQIVVAPGANHRLAPAAAAGVTAADRVCLAQLETPVDTVAAFLAAAGRYGARRILNAAPALPAGLALFPAADLLIVNETELLAYLGLAPGGNGAGAAAAVRRLFSRADQAAIVTLGAAGAVLVDGMRVTHIPPRPVTPIDTTGAGDCFCGALAALLADGMTLADAAGRAGIAAALCVERLGAGPAMPWRAEVDAVPDAAPSEWAHAVKNPKGGGVHGIGMVGARESEAR